MKMSQLQMMETNTPKGVQAKVQFSGFMLSIIQNEVSYGGSKGLYEIAVFSDDSQVELPGITNVGDTVKGWLTSSDVDAILTKMYTITGTEGKQI